MKRKYNVFISFKNSDEMGMRTKDSKLAEKCYLYLAGKGLDVFYSNIELEFIGKAQYSKVIDAALDSSRFMVVVGCSYDNFNSEWVRYEWESFLNDVRSGIKSDAEVFVIYQDMKISELPRALRQQQAFNADIEESFEKLYNFINAEAEPRHQAAPEKAVPVAAPPIIATYVPPRPAPVEPPPKPPSPVTTSLPSRSTAPTSKAAQEPVSAPAPISSGDKRPKIALLATASLLVVFVGVAAFYITSMNRLGGVDAQTPDFVYASNPSYEPSDVQTLAAAATPNIAPTPTPAPATPTPEPAPTPDATPEPTPEQALEPTPTPEPTQAPMPTPASTPVPTPAPAPAPAPVAAPGQTIAHVTIAGQQFSTSLTTLDLRDMGLRNEDIAPLRYMTNLTTLNLNNNQISDLSPLSGLTTLVTLRMSINQVTSLVHLSGLTNLTELRLDINPISDLAPLSNLTALEHLGFGNSQVDDITPLSNLTNLSWLALNHTNVSDIALLSGLRNLRFVSLVGLQVADYSPVEHVPDVRGRP